MSEPLPRVLIVEDDAVSRSFLREALCDLPVSVATVVDAVGALAVAEDRDWALVLLDLHLPDGDGAVLLPALRRCARIAAAVALTADPATTLDARLRGCGFDAIEHKPVSAAVLRQLVLRLLPAATAAPVAVAAGVAEPPRRTARAPDPAVLWDDVQALAAAGGHRHVVEALRGLLCTDLVGQRESVEAALAAGHTGAARAVLHRMQAACGFCGAAGLAAAVDALDRALASGDDNTQESAMFVDQCRRIEAQAR